MGIKRTGNTRRALMTALFALLVYASQGVFIWHLITATHISPLLGGAVCGMAAFATYFIMALLIIDIVLPGYLYVVLLRERGLRAAARHDAQNAPLATYQPETSRALRDGETLVLARRKRGNPVAATTSTILKLLVISLLLVASGESIVLILLPAPRHWITTTVLFVLSPIGDPQFLQLSPLDWFSVALPVVFGGIVLVSTTISGLRGRWQRTVADDRGITVTGSLLRRQFVPWADILVFMRAGDNPAPSLEGGYFLVGRHHLANFQIYGAEKPRAKSRRRAALKSTPLESPTQDATAPEPREYEYEGGFAAYSAAAEQLVATILARGYVPLRTSGGLQRLSAGMKRRFPAAALEESDLLAAPVAPSPLQPAPAAVEAAKGFTGELRLAVRLPWLPVLVETLLWALPIGGFTYAYVRYTQPETFQNPIGGSLVLVTTILVGFIALLSLFLGWAFAITRRQTRRPIIVADNDGLTRRGGSTNRHLPSRVLWRDIRAWAIIQPAPGSRRPPTVVILTNGQRLTWTEPPDARLAGRRIQGDQRAAYRERADQLHALIVARTGLPLHIIELSIPPAGG